MTQAMLRLLIPVLLVVMGVGAMFALGKRETGRRDERDTSPVVEVDTVEVLSHQGGLDIDVDGVVTPFREIQVAAEVGGRITEKADVCRAGYFVKAGTKLIQIDSSDYELVYQRAVLQRSQADDELEEVIVEIANTQALIGWAKQDLELQQQELQRSLRLSGGNAITQSDIDKSRRAVVTSENSLQILENQLRSLSVRQTRLKVALELADNEIKKADLDRQRTTVVAPIDGVIITDSVEKDAYVQKGTPLFLIEDTSSIEVKCNLKMDELYWLWRQQSVQTSEMPQQPGMAYRVPLTDATVSYQLVGRQGLRFSWDGVLSRYDGIGLDPRTRTVPCRITVRNPRQAQAIDAATGQPVEAAVSPPALVRGMYITAQIHARPSVNFVRVPDTAIQPGKRAWLLRHGKLQRVGPLSLVRFVSQTAEDGTVQDYWLVPSEESGLVAGDQLVITPLIGMRDGMQAKSKIASGDTAS